jgi:uncharacterized protein YjbI with pentapeptide repeats
MLDKRQRLRQLTSQIRHGDNKAALRAIDELRLQGWLTDGSLREADMHGANLYGADLHGAVLRNANLNRANLTRANLRDAFLMSATVRYADLTDTLLNEAVLIDTNLHGSVLHGTVLREADLTRSTLTRAVLTGTDMYGVELRGADLSNADLSRTFLQKANFYRTNLTYANLVGANLKDADLTGAYCRGTVFADIDLSEVQGLNAIDHLGPSDVGISTLIKSGNSLPIEFLRHSGVPEAVIDALPSLRKDAGKYHMCFIVHSKADKDVAKRVHDALQERGIRCWLDERRITPNDAAPISGNLGVRLWDKVLLVSSRTAMTSWWIENEIDLAFQKETVLNQGSDTPIVSLIPLDIDGYLDNGDLSDAKQAQLRTRGRIAFNDWHTDSNKFNIAVDQLVDALWLGSKARVG